MKYLLVAFLGLFSITSTSQNVKLPVDTTVVTNHTVNIKGKNINYSAQTGTQPVYNEDGEAVASLFYTYYKEVEFKILKTVPW
jgi:carboxypeptidase C (cathepsin A)